MTTHQLLTYALLCITSASGLNEQCNEPVSKEELIAFLDAQREAIYDSIVTLDVVSHTWTGIDVPDDLSFNMDEDEDTLQSAMTVKLMVSSDGHNVESRYRHINIDDDTVKEQMLGAYGVYVWDGVRSVSLGVRAEDDRPKMAIIRSRPDRAVIGEHWAVPLGLGLFGNPAYRSLHHFVSQNELDRVETDGEGRTVLVFIIESGHRQVPSDELRITVGRNGDRSELGLHLDKIALIRFSAVDHDDEVPDGVSQIRVVRTIEFGKPSRQFGALVPETMTATIVTFPNGEDPGSWWVRRIELKDVQSADEIHLRAASDMLESGVQLWDERYRIGYEIGSRRLNIDGRVLHTHRPLEGIVGENLGYWIEHGSFGRPDSP